LRCTVNCSSRRRGTPIFISPLLTRKRRSASSKNPSRRIALRRRAPEFRRCVLESCESQNLPVSDEEMARMRTKKPRRKPQGRPVSSVLRTRQGVRRPRRLRESYRYYERGNALKRADSDYGRTYRTQHATANRHLHSRVLRRPPGLGRDGWRSDFHRGTAPLRLDADRANPCLSFASRGTLELADILRIVHDCRGGP